MYILYVYKCSSNFVDDAKRTWFVEMKKLIIKIKRKILRSTNDETCKMNMDALEKKGFVTLICDTIICLVWSLL